MNIYIFGILIYVSIMQIHIFSKKIKEVEAKRKFIFRILYIF